MLSTTQGWSVDLMVMFGLTEMVGQMSMANCVRWYICGLRMKDGFVLMMKLDDEVEAQRKRGRLKRTWKRQVVEDWAEQGRCTLPVNVGCWF